MNCMAKLTMADNFCPQCGQENNTIRNTIGMVIRDSLSNFFSLDARVLHSLIPLITKPGYLSLEWRRGKRIQYLTPSRIYFVSSILFFLFMSLIQKDAVSSFAEGFKSGITEEELEVDSMEVANEKIKLGIMNLEIDTSAVNDSKELTDSSEVAELSNKKSINIDFSGTDVGKLYKLFKQESNLSSKDALVKLKIEESFLNLWISAQLKKVANFNPEDFQRFYQSKLPIILFFLLPVLALVLRLIYFRRDVYYSEHLVFAFHTQAVFFIVLLLMYVAEYYNLEAIMRLLLYLFIAYVIIALKQFYQQAWGKTIAKFFIINLAFLVTTIFFFAVASIIVFSIY